MVDNMTNVTFFFFRVLQDKTKLKIEFKTQIMLVTSMANVLSTAEKYSN